jgi:hypothetical protein
MGDFTRARSVRTLDEWARALRYFGEFSRTRGVFQRLASPGVELALLDWLSAGRSTSTVSKIVGALRSALALLDEEEGEAVVLDLLRAGMRAGAPAAAPPPDGVPVATLLEHWRTMPVSSARERRDRAVVLAALLLGTRPRDLTCLRRGDPGLLRIGADGDVRLRFVADKGSRLVNAAASGFVFVPHVDDFPLGKVLQQVLSDVPEADVAAVDGGLPLFVSMDGTRRGQPLSVDTVSNILCRFLVSVGLRDDAAQARQVRAYVASSAYELGVDIQDICDHFRWSDAATFRRHYRRHGLEIPLPSLPRGGRRGFQVVRAFELALGRDRVDRGTHPPSFVPRGFHPRPGTGSGRSFNAATPSEAERSDAE